MDEGTSMRSIGTIALVLACLFSAPGRAAEDDLARAQRLLRGGKYAEAAEIYALSAPRDERAAVGLSRALAAEGKLDEAARALTAAGEEHADCRAELARLAFERGDYDTARAHGDKAIRLDPTLALRD